MLPKKLWFLESMKRPWPPISFENDFYPPKNTKNGIHPPKNHENGPSPPKNDDPPPFGCFWHLPLVLCLFLKCSMYHEELPDPKKVCKLNRLQHEVLHIYVRVYSAYKNEYCEYILSQFTHFLPSEVMSIQFLLFSYSPLQWLFNSQYLYKRLSQLLQ